MGQDDKEDIASAMVNRMDNHDQSIEEMTDKLMFWSDNHEKKMSETERKPGNKDPYPDAGKNATHQDVSTQAYRKFMETSKSGRNNNASMKGAVKATVKQLANPKDRVKGADSWRGNGKTHRFFKSSKAKKKGA